MSNVRFTSSCLAHLLAFANQLALFGLPAGVVLVLHAFLGFHALLLSEVFLKG